MLDYFNQLEAAAKLGLHHVALQSALCVPDICSALESPDGRANMARYIGWFDRWMGPHVTRVAERLPEPPTGPEERTFLDGQQAYYLRCTLLHQGVGQPTQSNHTHPRIVFLLPNHDVSISSMVFWPDPPDVPVYQLELARFCSHMANCGRLWLVAVQNEPDFQLNYQTRMKHYPMGLDNPRLITAPTFG